MLDQQERELLGEPPLDFTQFLCARLKLDPKDTLALLGSFLLSFEPTSNQALRTHAGSTLPSD